APDGPARPAGRLLGAERAESQRVAVAAGPGELGAAGARAQRPAARGGAPRAERQRGGPRPPGPVRRPARPALGGVAPADGQPLPARQRRLPALLPLRRRPLPPRAADDLRDAGPGAPRGRPGAAARPRRPARPDRRPAPGPRPRRRGTALRPPPRA